MGPGDVVAGRFLIESAAGSGGMGTVFRARDEQSGAALALKVLRDCATSELHRFAREARLLARLKHPGVVRYIDHGSATDGQAYMAMEWLEGENLLQRLTRGALSVSDSLAVGRRAADALAYAHSLGVVHRDIKPSNLFLVGGSVEHIKVLDFGVARLGRIPTTLTGTGAMLGTPGYMAPEQARGERNVDARADVFSLGCVLYRCLAGKPPFGGQHAAAVLAKILLEEAPPLRSLRRDVPRALEELVVRMLSKQAAERPSNCAAVRSALEGIELDSEGAMTDPPTPISSALGTSERRLVSVVLAAPGGSRAQEPQTSLSTEDSAQTTDPPTIVDLPSDPLAAEPPSNDLTPRVVDPSELEASSGHAEPLERAEESSAPATSWSTPQAGRRRLERAAQPFGARVEWLADGTVVSALTGMGNAVDQAARAAQCALALAAELDSARVVLATGRELIGAGLPMGETIDRAVAMLRAVPRRALAGTPLSQLAPIAVDEMSAGLLEGRYHVGRDGKNLVLLAEKDPHEASRTLLGRTSPCVGRERELSVLLGTFEECIEEPVARAVMVTAPPGVGKSRLRYEFVRRVLERGEPVEIWTGRGDPMATGSAFGMLADALRGACRMRDGEPLELSRRKLRERVARSLSGSDLERVVDFMGELAGAPSPDEGRVELRAARRDKLLMGDQIRRAWEDWLRAECAARPLLLVLEDLHWGDVPTMRLVDAALRGLREAPLMVLALGRPEVERDMAPLWSAHAVTKLPLDTLPRRAATRLVREMLGAELAPETVERIVAQSAGNALYLEELIRAVAEGRGDALPETVLAMVQARLESMEGSARRVLRAASVFGQIFWRGAASELLGVSVNGELDEWLNELAERELITRRAVSRFAGEDEYAFRHELVREGAYAMLTADDRRLGHQLAAGWFERVGERDAVVLAEHLERGGESERAAAFYLRAAEQALEGGDFAAALSRSERGAACGAAHELLGRLRLCQAQAHNWRGQNAEAADRAREALGNFETASELWYRAMAELAPAIGRVGDREALAGLVERTLELSGTGEAGGAALFACARLALQALFLGLPELGARVLAWTETRAAQAAGDPAALAWLYRARGGRAAFANDLADYRAQLELARQTFSQAGDLRNALMEQVNIGYLLIELGEPEQAEQQIRAAIADGERLGLDQVVATGKHNLGLALARQGRFERGIAVERDAAQTFRAMKNRRLEATSWTYVAEMYAESSDHAAAEGAIQAALDTLTVEFPVRAYALALLSRVRLAQGRAREALELARQAVDTLERLGGRIEDGERLSWLCLALALEALGDIEGAKKTARTAKQLLDHCALKIKDPVQRQRFLERVPENARTLALTNRLLDAPSVSA